MRALANCLSSRCPRLTTRRFAHEKPHMETVGAVKAEDGYPHTCCSLTISIGFKRALGAMDGYSHTQCSSSIKRVQEGC